MGSVGAINRQTRRMVVAFALVAAMIVASFLPTLAWAAQLSDRSVAVDSSKIGKTGVTYNIKFDQATNADAVVIQFCTNTPLIGEFCDAPGGMVVTGATAGTGVTAITSATGSTIKLTKAGATEDLTITGITNPAARGTVYARILTYVDSTAAGAYTVDEDTNKAIGTPVDQGSVAIAFTDDIEVSGAVLETLTFCVSRTDLTSTNCTIGYNAPVLTLGEDDGNGVVALSSSKVSTGDIYTKISTNAVKGAVVSLKSTAGVNQPGNVPCAGLALAGTGACNIAAAGTTGTFGDASPDAKFGVKLKLPDTNDNSDGNGIIALDSNYDTSDYRLDGAAAIGTYGDAIYTTNGGYANNRNVMLTFGAKSAANTPAGKYSAAISLIATGTF